MESVKVMSRASQPMMSEALCDALVLDARLRQSMVAVRSLGNQGLRVAALETYGVPAPTFSSRWCQQRMLSPAAEGTQEYLTYLEQAIDSTGARVLITSSDGTIALIRRHREQLERRVRIALAKESALSIAIDKEQTLAIAEQLGVGVPRAVSIRTRSDMEVALREIGLPAVVKPAESWLWGKRQGTRVISQLVTTPAEARFAIEELIDCGGTVLYQQFLSGRRESLSLFYANGEVYARFAFWGKRTNPPLGGIYVLRQAIDFPSDTGEQAERLIRAIDLEGYSQVEFRRDSAGKPYLMEINSRMNLGIEVAVRAGVDFPYLLYQWANGERINTVKSYRTGGQMRHLGGDILTTIAAVQQRGRPDVAPPWQVLLDFFCSFFVPMGYDYFDWRDPLPVLPAVKGFIHSTLRQIREVRSKKKLQKIASR